MTDSTLMIMDTLPSHITDIYDTNVINISGTATVSVVGLSTDNQPNGWIQLLLPIAITLLVVFIDKWVMRFYERRDAKTARKQFRDTVLDWIEKIKPIEESFSISVNQLSQSLKDYDDMQPLLYAMPLTLPNKLGDMTIEKMSDAFLKDFKNNKEIRYANMYNIISSLEFLSRIVDVVKESYDSYNKQSFALCNEWNKMYEEFIEMCDEKGAENPYEEAMKAWFTQLMGKQNSIKIHIQNLDELYTLANEMNDSKMMTQINKMRHIVQKSQATSSGYAQVFENIAKNIRDTLTLLTSSKIYLKTNNEEKERL